MDTTVANVDECPSKQLKENDLHRERLSKTLSYLLRYGALKEGLKVDDNGFVDLEELLGMSQLGHYSCEEIKDEIKHSTSQRGSSRFECHTDGGRVLVRASYGRKLEKNPFHEGTCVLTLFESSMRSVITHLNDFDLQDFPDDYLIGTMLHRLAQDKKLTTKSLKVLLVPALEHLNLEDVYLTQNTLRMMYAGCPNLKSLSLRNCTYIVTDTMLGQLTKKMGQLEFLNLTGCHHLTDRGLQHIKNLPCLARLGLSFNKGITEAGVIDLLLNVPALELLDIYSVKVSLEGREMIDQIRTSRKIVVILRGLEEKDANGVRTHIKPTVQKGVM